MVEAQVGVVFIVLFVLTLISTGCQTPITGANPDKVYRRDMIITINGQTSEGVLVVRRAPIYQINVESKASLDLFTLQSCHRETLITDVKESGIFARRSRVRLNYTPSAGIEDTGACPLQLGGYDKSQGKHSWAFVDFETPAETLEAQVFCNGDSSVNNGVSLCQSRAGLIQRMVFEKPVMVSPDPGCELPAAANNIAFRFPIQKGICVYLFVEIDNPHRAHRLTTIGYEEILIRTPQGG